MPIKIDCPDCDIWSSGLCKTCNNTGKITVYTEAEMQEMFDKYKQSGLAQFKNRKMYSLKELNRAIQEEREAIITLGLERLKNYSGHYLTQVLYQFIEVIRARSK